MLRGDNGVDANFSALLFYLNHTLMKDLLLVCLINQEVLG